MTRNQIEYLKLQEEQRANKAKERENNRSNVAREVETNRSNLENEKVNLINSTTRAGELAETVRSNKAREYETHRSNVAGEAIKIAANEETKRSNLAREFETHRSNVANEAINQDRNDLTREHYERSDTEMERSNRAREALSAEQNAIKREEIQLGYAGVDQRERASQRQYESSIYGSSAAASASRYAADTNAAVQWGSIAEQNRHNQAMEWNQQLGIASDYKTKHEQNQNTLTGLQNQQSRWEGEAGLRESQTNLNNERAQSESELRNAKRHNLYSSTVNNYTRSFANVFSTITGGAKRGKNP